MGSARRCVLAGAFILAGSMTAGSELVAKTHAGTCFTYPCDVPPMLPYFLHGLVLLVVGGLIGLILISIGVRNRMRTSSQDPQPPNAVL